MLIMLLIPETAGWSIALAGLTLALAGVLWLGLSRTAERIG